MLKLEPRPQPSQFWSFGSPILALVITVVIGVLLFAALGKDPVRGLQVFFWEPIKSPYALGELALKATPLLLIALGLAVCFRSNVWNIGAEGQFVIGAVAAGGVALAKMETFRSECGAELRCPAALAGDLSTARLAGHASTVGFAVAGAGAAMGAVLLLLPPSRDKGAPSVSVGVSPFGVIATGRF